MTHEEDIKRTLGSIGELKELKSSSLTSQLSKEMKITTVNGNKLDIQIYKNDYETENEVVQSTYSIIVKLEIEEDDSILKRNILNIQSTKNIIETIELSIQSILNQIMSLIGTLDGMVAAATEVQNFIDENTDFEVLFEED